MNLRLNFAILTIFVTAIAALSNPASAAEGEMGQNLKTSYFGISYVNATYSESGFEAKPTALDFRIGNMVSDYIGFEGRLGFGLSDDNAEICFYYCYDGSIEIDNYYSLFGRAYFAKNGQIRPYALLGYTRGKLSASAAGESVSASESDVSFGIGLDIGSPDNALAIEYINLLDKDGAEVDGLTIGYKTNF